VVGASLFNHGPFEKGGAKRGFYVDVRVFIKSKYMRDGK
jgi:hypothetical protein